MASTTPTTPKLLPLAVAIELAAEVSRQVKLSNSEEMVLDLLVKSCPVVEIEEHKFLRMGEVHGFLQNLTKAIQTNDFSWLLQKRGILVDRVVDVEEFVESPEYMDQKRDLRPAIKKELLRLFDPKSYYIEAVLCLHGDTRVPLLDGTMPTIRELAETRADDEFWVYSQKNGQKVPARARLPRKTGHDTIWRVTFTDGTHIEGNSRHQFIMTGGQKVMIKNIKPGDRLESLYLYYGKLTAQTKSKKEYYYYIEGKKK